MAVSHARITVSTSPVALNPGGTSGGRLYIRNESANACDIGGLTVAAGAGMSLAANTSLPFPLEIGAGDQVYAIRSGASDAVLSVVRV